MKNVNVADSQISIININTFAIPLYTVMFCKYNSRILICIEKTQKITKFHENL